MLKPQKLDSVMAILGLDRSLVARPGLILEEYWGICSQAKEGVPTA
jgi:hypothetical protein